MVVLGCVIAGVACSGAVSGGSVTATVVVLGCVVAGVACSGAVSGGSVTASSVGTHPAMDSRAQTATAVTMSACFMRATLSAQAAECFGNAGGSVNLRQSAPSARLLRRGSHAPQTSTTASTPGNTTSPVTAHKTAAAAHQTAAAIMVGVMRAC